MDKPAFNQDLCEVWQSMKKRCYRVSAVNFERYGGRGIKVCDEWLTSFTAFKEWALANGWSKGLQLDRIDNNRGYSPGNCKFSTPKEQANNRRSNVIVTYQGKSQSLKMWAEELGLQYYSVQKRIKKLNWSVERAFETPIRTHKEYKTREVRNGKSIPDTC